MKKKRVAIIAPTGMLGSMVYRELKNKYNLVLVYRNTRKVRILDKTYGNTSGHEHVRFDFSDAYNDYLKGFPHSKTSKTVVKLVERIGPVTGVVNCAGITKPRSLDNPAITFFINGVVPHILSRHYGSKLIHITTDCVYDGIDGKAPYSETAPFNPTDLYGVTKNLGEPSHNSLVLRTSIIGPEIEGHTLLIGWFRKQSGKTVSGFTNHYWNGITTKEYARICDLILSSRSQFPETGLFHIFSNDVSKYEMLQAFKKKYKIDVTIKKKKAFPIDRRLSSVHSLHNTLKMKSFSQMIDEL